MAFTHIVAIAVRRGVHELSAGVLAPQFTSH